MPEQNMRGWGFQEIGWLLGEVEAAGGGMPMRYKCTGSTPADFKSVRDARSKLGQSISWAFTWERVQKNLGGTAGASRRLELIGRIQGQLQRALRGFESDPTLVTLLNPSFPRNPETGVGLHEIIEGIGLLDEAFGVARREFSEEGFSLGGTGQELIFQGLAKAYREGMDAEPNAGIIKTHRSYDGPFVAFVRAAFVLAGRPAQSGDALTKALQRHVIEPPSGQ